MCVRSNIINPKLRISVLYANALRLKGFKGDMEHKKSSSSSDGFMLDCCGRWSESGLKVCFDESPTGGDKGKIYHLNESYTHRHKLPKILIEDDPLYISQIPAQSLISNWNTNTTIIQIQFFFYKWI